MGLVTRELVSGPALGTAQIRPLLEKYGLRATRQRLGLAKLLFSKGNRHITADVLATEAHEARMFASLATVYNVLNLFAEVGLVRSFTVEGGKTIFDTNTTDHCHYYFEDSGRVSDIMASSARVGDRFEAPEGYEVVKVDVVVRLRPIGSQKAAVVSSDGTHEH